MAQDGFIGFMQDLLTKLQAFAARPSVIELPAPQQNINIHHLTSPQEVAA